MDAMSFRSAAREALALLVPVSCVGCAEPGEAVCAACLAGMPGTLSCRQLEPGFTVWAGTGYTGITRRAVLALKNEQRTDAARALAPHLAAAVEACLSATRPAGMITLAALPSSRAAFRRRGYRPVDVVVARTGWKLEHPLAWARQPGDQIGLTVEARNRNLHGSLRARRRVHGRSFLLVDDVVTTGATLREARRALSDAGAGVVGAAVIAGTERRLPGQSHVAHFAE